MGFDPMVQIMHVEDVVSAIERTLMPGVRGVFNLAGPSPVPLSLLFDKLDRDVLRVPETIARALLEAGWSLKLSDWPVPEVDHIKYVCMVDDSNAREQLGFTHDHSVDDILDDIDAMSLL
jgi:UDP-glucose 4-epimerase